MQYIEVESLKAARRAEQESHAKGLRKNKLVVVKKTLRAYLELAPREFDAIDSAAWLEGADQLMLALALRRIGIRIDRSQSEKLQRANFENALALFRARITDLGEADV